MRYLTSSHLVVAALFAGLSSQAAMAEAPQEDIETLKAEVKSLEIGQRAAQENIAALVKRIEALESANRLTSGSLMPDSQSALMRGRGLAYAQGAAQPAPGAAQPAPGATDAAQEPDRKTPAPTEAVEAVTRAEQGYFGQNLTIEPGIAYSHFSNAQLNLSGFLALDAIFLGLISIDQLSADVITTDVTGRLGFGRFQADINVPYLYRRSNFRSGGAGGNASGLTEKTITSRGLGDVSGGLSYRAMAETSSRPNVVVNVRVKAPTGRDPFGVRLIEVDGSEGNLKVPARLSTGSGVWGAAAGVSLLKTLDPMVVFGSLTYFYNFEQHFPDLDEAQGDQPGEARLGGALQYGLGVAFALNDRSSLSASFTQRFVRHSELRSDPTDLNPDPQWRRVVGSQANVGILNLGATFTLSPRLTLLTNLSTGITDDAPDMVLSVRLPYRF